jgi:malonyl CoA-acyl carrier protein transacylase/NAD(P)-dependent dehydrogenase (short-subunit alcohol dehydrogenase family)
MGLLRLLEALGVRPDLVAGHSYGENVALAAAGAFGETELARISEARGRCLAAAAGDDSGRMAAVQAGSDQVTGILAGLPEVWIANLNAPSQTVISGVRASVEEAVARANALGIRARLIPVACAFHTPLVAGAGETFARVLSENPFEELQLTVFSNTTAEPYPTAPHLAAARLLEHMVKPVRFADEVLAMHEAGTRVFVEVGPGGVLTSLVQQVLGERDFLAVATDLAERNGLTQLQDALGQMWVAGVPVCLDRLFRGRGPRRLDLRNLAAEVAARPLPPSTWMLGGGLARPLHEPLDPVRRPPAALAGLSLDGRAAPAGLGAPFPLGAASADLAATGDIPVDSALARTVLRHERLMQHLLDTHREVMLQYLRRRPAEPDGPAMAPPTAGSPEPDVATSPANEPLRRLVATPVPAEPCGPTGRRFPADPLLLLTEDGRGVSQRLADLIRDRGGRVISVRLGSSLRVVGEGAYEADLTDPSAVEEFVAAAREKHGSISGVVHLLPLGNEAALGAMDLAAWRGNLRRDVKSLFHLARAAAADLQRAAEQHGAWFAAASSLGGAWGMDSAGVGDADRAFAGQAGIAGLVKAAAREWPQVRCKAVDLDRRNAPAVLAEQMLQEMLEPAAEPAGDGLVEVGYQGSARRRMGYAPLALDEADAVALEPEPDWVVLLTGGARGITAEIGLELAARYRPTLLVVGTSPLPGEEPADAAGLSSPQDLRAALIARRRSRGETASIAGVEDEYRRLTKAREIRGNLEAMSRAGATVRYYQADVRDEEAMSALIQGIYREYGRLDGVVHGAGIIEDKLLADKPPEAFDRVFDTKADSAFILSRQLRPDSLKFLVLFSSTAGVFGNRGQCDYAAANEVLNKLAVHLDFAWPGRVVAINWGPWAKTGMVTAELERELARHGMALLPAAAGRGMFDAELRRGRKGEAEVIVAGGVGPAPGDREKAP